jgi:hypothetical protein
MIKVTVEVANIDRDALDNSVSIRLSGSSPERFVRIYLRRLQELLGRLTGVRSEHVRILSIVGAPTPEGAGSNVTSTQLERRRRHAIRRRRRKNLLGRRRHRAAEPRTSTTPTYSSTTVASSTEAPSGGSLEVLFAIVRGGGDFGGGVLAGGGGTSGYHRPDYVRQKVEAGVNQLTAALPGLRVVSLTSEVLVFIYLIHFELDNF